MGSAASGKRSAATGRIATWNRKTPSASGAGRRRRAAPARLARTRGTGRQAGAGGIAQAMEALRDQRGLPWLADLARDLRYGCRMLARNPGFTIVAVLSLAIGIGANCAVFSFADTLLLRPLPVPRPGELLTVGFDRPLAGTPGCVVSRLRRHPGSQQELRGIGRVHESHGRLRRRCRRRAETEHRHVGERQLLPASSA